MIRAGIVVLIAIALPFLLGQFWAYQLGLYALYAAAAVGVGLCWGQAGFLPLGQALFFGLAAYLSGLAFIAFQDSPIVSVLTLPLAAIVSGVLAYLIGIVIFRRSGESGAYFSMITLALALLAFQIATSWNSVTGGFNGLKGIPGLPGLDDISDVYYVAASVLLALLAFGAWLYNAPIGVLWRALAQNERRLKLFGFDTDQLKAVAFGVSGLMAGIGGAIYAPQQGIVTPQVIGFGLSADLVIWAAVGGRASLLGPVIGTLVVGSLTAQLRDTLPFWEVLMALFFIAIVLVFPRGIAGLADPLLRYFPARKREKAALAAPGDAAARPPAKLALDGVSVHVGEVTILDKLSVDFDQAGIFCVIGPNGAGKTSMFNVVSGELSTASGAIDLGGLKIAGLAPNRVSGLGVARKLQIPSVFPELSIADNLAVALWSGRAGKLALLDPQASALDEPDAQGAAIALSVSGRERAQGRGAVAWRATNPRTRHGAFDRAARLAARRALRRLVARRDFGGDGDHPLGSASARRLDHHHRARHEPGEGTGADRLRPAQRRAARQGQCRRHSGRPGRARGLCRGREVSARRLAFENLTGGYGSTTIVRDLSGGAVAGEVLCVLGRNGVGKTTLMKLLTGYLPCTHGRVLLDDTPITAYDPAARRRAGVTYCPQERPVFDDLSVRDNLTLMRDSRKLAPFRRYFDRFPILERRLNQHAGTLSGGEKKMLSFSRGLAEDQPVILLDEPSEGVQWENILHMEALIAEKKSAGAAMIVVEQNLAFAERIADRYLIMDQGRAMLEGSRSEIERSDVLAHLHV